VAEENGTTEQAKQPTPGSPPSTAPAKPRRGPSRGAVITFLIAIPIVLVATWFGGEIRAFFALQPWNKSLPRDTVQKFVTALEANDRAAMKAVADQGLVVTPPDEGPIIALKIGGPPMEPPKDIEMVRPLTSVSDARIQYDFRDVKALVNVHMTAEAGNPVVFVVQPVKGEWRVKGLSLMP